MSPSPRARALTRQDMEAILAVTRALAAPFDLHSLLAEVAAAACRVLRCERSSVWLHDPVRDELFVEVASDLDRVRVPVGSGLVGQCALLRSSINVTDCYADPRFNREVDLRTGFHTRCSLTLPLTGMDGGLVGVLQMLNKASGVFDIADEALAEALAAQCAVAIARARATQDLLTAERLRREIELAAVVQRSTLPSSLPRVDGYAMHAEFLPASLTGGDTFDVAQTDQGLLLVLADATGHGIAPALSVVQMQAMLRTALRLGAGLEAAFRQVNDQLCEVLPDGRFVTAFVGLLDTHKHVLRFLSGGQSPILHFQSQPQTWVLHRATSFPMGAMPIVRLAPPVELIMAPGDWLLLLTDGIFEAADPTGALFGRQGVQDVVSAHQKQSPAALAARLIEAVRVHAQGTPQDDDITMVLVRRHAST